LSVLVASLVAYSEPRTRHAAPRRLIQRYPEVLDAAEVVADQLVQALALVAVDRDLVAAGHQNATSSASV
jgi:hypothetical protein